MFADWPLLWRLSTGFCRELPRSFHPLRSDRGSPTRASISISVDLKATCVHNQLRWVLVDYAETYNSSFIPHSRATSIESFNTPRSNITELIRKDSNPLHTSHQTYLPSNIFTPSHYKFQRFANVYEHRKNGSNRVGRLWRDRGAQRQVLGSADAEIARKLQDQPASRPDATANRASFRYLEGCGCHREHEHGGAWYAAFSASYELAKTNNKH